MSWIHEILVPTDFSPDSEKALERAIDLAQRFGAKIRLLHCYQIAIPEVNPYTVADPAAISTRIRERAVDLLANSAEQVSAAGVEVEQSLVQRDPRVCIATEARFYESDLIVMGTRGHSRLSQLLLGSVAKATIRDAPCPVWTMCQQDAESDVASQTASLE